MRERGERRLLFRETEKRMRNGKNSFYIDPSMPNIKKLIINVTPRLVMGFIGLDISIQKNLALTTITHVLLNRMTRTTRFTHTKPNGLYGSSGLGRLRFFCPSLIGTWHPYSFLWLSVTNSMKYQNKSFSEAKLHCWDPIKASIRSQRNWKTIGRWVFKASIWSSDD